LLVDGTINEAFVAEHYGLGIEEASQEIQFGAHKGTVAQMLADEACPVGGQIQNAYKQQGIEGVARVFEGIKMMDPNFAVEISASTLEREQAKQASQESEPVNKEPEQDTSLPPEDPEDLVSEDRAAILSTHRHETTDDEEIINRRDAETTERTEQQNRTDEAAEAEDAKREIIADSETEPEPVRETIATITLAQAVKPRVNVEKVDSASPVATKPAFQPGPEINPVETYEEEQIPLEKPARQNVLPINARKKPDVSTPPQLESRPPYKAPAKPGEVPGKTVAHEATKTESLPIELISDQSLDAESAVESEMLLASDEAVSASDFMESIQLILDDNAGDLETTVSIEISEAMTPASVELSWQISEALQNPEVRESDPVQAAIAEISQTIEDLKLLEETGEEIAEVERNLVTACEKLLDELDISYEQETIEQFVKLLLATQKVQSETDDLVVTEKPINEEGTHEFKPGILDIPGLVLRARHKFLPLKTLGQWAVASSLA
jgi:hypothetical protein